MRLFYFRLLAVLLLEAGFGKLCLQAQFTQVGDQLDGIGTNDNFGYSVALSQHGKILAAGGPLFGDDIGQVRVFEETGGVWTQMGAALEGSAIGNQYGGAVALSDGGQRLALGAIAGTNAQEGQVRIYAFFNNTWTLFGDSILGEATGDQFGWSLDMNGNGTRLVAGAPRNDGNGADAGHVRVFEWQNNSWVQLGSDIDGPAAGNQWGSSVAMNHAGDIIAIGSTRYSGSFSSNGLVRVYQWSNNSWTQIGGDIEGGTANEFLGGSVSLSKDGQTLAVSAAGHNHGSGIGSVRVFKLSNDSWQAVGADIRGSSTNEAFGEEVVLNGDGTRIAIGTRSSDENGISSGRLNVFEWTNNSWTPLYDPVFGKASFDYVGSSLAFNEAGTRIAIGANLANGTKGYVSVYQDSLMPVNLSSLLELPGISLGKTSTGWELRSTQPLNKASLQLSTLTGQKVWQARFSGSIYHFQTPLPEGIYLLRLTDGQRAFIQKIVVQNR